MESGARTGRQEHTSTDGGMTMAGKRKSAKSTPGQINIEALIENRGQITIGCVLPFECVAIANDEHNTVASLVRKPNESVPELLERLDMAIEAAYEHDEIIDEVNDRP